jgi:N-methylhydantoinase A
MTQPKNPTRPSASWRIGIDVGGTFTDMVLVDKTGRVIVAKSPSTPSDPSVGVVAVVERMATTLGTSASQLLEQCDHFVHASTIATNIVLERRGNPVGMLVTKGFRDSLAIRRGIRANAWAHRIPFPPVLAPRYLRLPVGGRIDRNGKEIDPLSKDDIQRAIDVFVEEKVGSIAICLFNSFLNQAHEHCAFEILQKALPGIPVSISSAIAPVMGEYERSSTAVLNAYVAPQVVSYLRNLEYQLKIRGLRVPVLVVQNNGGSLTIEDVASRPVSMLLSGPAAAAGALSLYANHGIASDLLSMEIGGTSCDVLIRTGQSHSTTAEFELGGYHLALPSINVHSIGAGGGTIAGVDRFGMLFVGPRGAGAQPGPAAYGFGGQEPTITDAQLVLGRLKPGKLTDEISLDLELARESIETKIAAPLGLSVASAAAGMIKIMEQQLLHAAQKISAEQGYDPRHFVLVAAGGAGPMYGASIARKLKAAAAYVPKFAGTFCAIGMLNAPISHEASMSFNAPLDDRSLQQVLATFEALESDVRAQLLKDGFAAAELDMAWEISLRHPGQIGSIGISISREEWRPASLASAFVEHHGRHFGYSDPSATIEIVSLRAIGRGRLPPIELIAQEFKSETAPLAEIREVYFDEIADFISTKVYRGNQVPPGANLKGPAIVEEDTMTVVIGPYDTGKVDAFGNYLIELDNEH